jgi:hypothetical protein
MSLVQIPRRGADPFISPVDVEEGDVCTITEPPYIQPAEKTRYQKERTVITVQVQRTGEVYRWGLNTTSNDRLVEAFGTDGDMWTGLRVAAELREMNVSGVMKTVLYARPLVQTKIAPADPSD